MIQFVTDRANILASAKHLIETGRAPADATLNETISLLHKRITQEFKHLENQPAPQIIENIPNIYGPLFALPARTPDVPEQIVIHLYARLSDKEIAKWTFDPL